MIVISTFMTRTVVLLGASGFGWGRAGGESKETDQQLSMYHTSESDRDSISKKARCFVQLKEVLVIVA